MTVAELKIKLENVPDDMEGEEIRFSGRVWCNVTNCPDCGGEGTCYPPKFVISSD